MKNSDLLNSPSAIIAPEAQPESNDGSEKITIRLQLLQLSPNVIPYRLHSHQFVPTEDQPIQVQVQVEKRYVKAQKEDGTIVLSPLGLAKMVKIISNAIEKVSMTED